MTDKQLKKLHTVLQEILDYVVSVCEKNNLTYFLVYGTALGAYRHNGFIPWDDDLDIAMPREDYQKFIKIMNCNDIHVPYQIQYEKNEPKYFLSFVKVRKKNTIFIENIAKETYNNNGIYIDIFPLDYINNAHSLACNLKRKYINYIKHILKVQACPDLFRLKYGNIRYLIDRIIGFPSLIISNQKLLAHLNKIMIGKCSLTDAHYIVQYDETTNAAVEKKTVYFPPRKILFEGKLYNAPNNIQDYLSNQYGENYMELPSFEKRITHNPIKLKF